MRLLTPEIRRRWRQLLLALQASDDDIGDDLLRHLVSTVYGARTTLYASMAMGVMIAAAAWAFTGAWVFAALTLAHVVVGVARLGLLGQYGRAGGAHADRATTLAFDRKFNFWSSMFALLLGLEFYAAAVVGDRELMQPLAIGGAVGFPIAFVARNSGRPQLLRRQIVAVIAPVVFAYVTSPIRYGDLFATLLLGLAVSAFVLGQHSYAGLLEHYRVNDANRRFARFDTLTGLINRRSFNEALAGALTEERGQPPRRFALVSVDLDRFKDVNDTEGHAAGDAVIVETARRLVAITAPGDVVARIGGDEFVLLAHRRQETSSRDASGPAEFAARIVAALGRPIYVEGVALPMTASVGIALYPDHGAEADDLMKRSDIALYEAKRSGRGRFHIFDRSMQARLDHARTLEIELQRAIREDQFEAWFQPINNLETGKPLGYEALARWRHPTRGLIAPDHFIPVAEQNGAIVDIGKAMLEKACAAAVLWDRGLTVAVNLSPVEFRQPRELVGRIMDTLRRTGLDPARLYVEVTESLMLEDTPQTRDAVRELAGYGVRFALDDFGAGYSSLSYIKDYPFSKIKIDRKFVDRIDSDPVSSAIVASVCVLGERTNMDIVAEGVETLTQEIALRRLGIRHAQGYLYGRPGPKAIAPQAPRLNLVACA